MAKWIASGSIICKEVKGSRVESYNSTSGSPVYRVRLEVPNGQMKNALAALMGIPETWPHITNFLNVRCISADLVSDTGEYGTDSDNQILIPNNPNLVDLTYMPRTGVYTQLEVVEEESIDVYIDSTLEPRNESRPLNPEHFIWGNITDTVPSDKTRTLLYNQAPVKYEPGDTFTHTVEGWPYDTTDLEDKVGTCNDVDFYSAVLNRTFLAGTLMLESIQITKAFSFITYRLPAGTPPTPPLYDYAGLAVPTLKFIYNYKKIGWQKFYRYDLDTTAYPEGYYYIRHAKDPWDKYLPFPLVDHSKWLY